MNNAERADFEAIGFRREVEIDGRKFSVWYVDSGGLWVRDACDWSAPTPGRDVVLRILRRALSEDE